MNNCLIYTFKNFPYKSALRHSVFEFHRLKADLTIFEAEIQRLKPRIIIGVAKSFSSISRFESKAVNIFNQSKKVDKLGVAEYSLNYPVNGFKAIGVSTSFTDSFCNWTIYRISQLLVDTESKLQFIHIAEPDLPDLENYLIYIRNSKV